MGGASGTFPAQRGWCVLTKCKNPLFPIPLLYYLWLDAPCSPSGGSWALVIINTGIIILLIIIIIILLFLLLLLLLSLLFSLLLYNIKTFT